MTIESVLILCDCKDPEHQMIVSYDTVVDMDYWDELYIHTHLPKRSFWSRLKYAGRYIFGWQSKTGAFGEIVLTESQATKLRDVCNAYLANTKEFKENKSK